MTKKMALGLGWLALGLTVFACGGTSDADDEAAGGSSASGGEEATGGVGGQAQGGATNSGGPELDELPALMADAYCDVLADCIPEDLIALWLGTPDCAVLMERRIENGFYPAAEQAIADGTLIYDPSKVESCLAAIRDGGCATNREYSECEAAMDGTVAEGEDCVHDAECAGNLVCIVDGLCPGQCQERLADGEPCTREDDCREGSVCFDSRCTSQLSLDDDCTEAGVDCAGGLLCAGANDEEGQTGTCQPWDDVFSAVEGDSCDLAGTLCESGSACVITVVAGELDFTCGPRVQSGGDCGLAIPDMCPTGEYCAGLDANAGDFEGTCAPLPGNDEPCVDNRCAGFHVCVEGTCVRMKENGADCSTHEECYSGRCRDGACSPDTDCVP